MGSRAAAGLSKVELSCIGMDGQDHTTGTVSDAVVGIGGNIVKDLVDGVVGGSHGGVLLLDKFAENYQ